MVGDLLSSAIQSGRIWNAKLLFPRSEMNVGTALVIWLIVLVFVYLIARYQRIRGWSALVLGLVIAFIVLIIIRPLSLLDVGLTGQDWTKAVYALVLYLTPITAVVYILLTAWKDKAPQPYVPVTTVN